jgi:hypothetical protein
MQINTDIRFETTKRDCKTMGKSIEMMPLFSFWLDNCGFIKIKLRGVMTLKAAVFC